MKVETMSFNDLVDCIYNLPLEDRKEIINLLEHNVADSQREEIFKNFKNSMVENKENKLEFSSKISELKKML